MNKFIERLVICVGVLAFLLLVGGCVNWRWNECTKVGHSALYCVMDMGRK